MEEEKQRLTLQAKSSFGPAPPPFHSWFVKDGIFHMPRFYGLERYGQAETDMRSDGKSINVSFTGSLTPIQERATRIAFDKYLSPLNDGGVIICLPCGYGKTVWAVNAILCLGRKACIFVHKSFLRDQWIAAFERFAPGIRMGTIQGNTWDVDGSDVVIAMIMTMAKRNYDSSLFEEFGTICFDECHHMAAPVMNMATRCMNARYVIGLTATKDRPDGLTRLLHWSLGPEGFHVERESELLRVSVALFSGGSKEILKRDGKPLISIMVNNLAVHIQRNKFICERIVEYRRCGRVIIVLSDRIIQLHTLRAMVIASGLAEEEIGFFTGETKEQQRKVELAKPVVMCSYGMANEGLDKVEADTCVMATPKGRVVQCIGRIQRPCETKKTPLVLDVADDVSVFVPLRWKRQQMYSKQGYEVQVKQCCEGEGWFE